MTDLPDGAALADGRPDPPLPDLPCRDLVELVTDYLEGALDADTANRLVAHLASCESCMDYIEQMRSTAGLAASLTDDDLPRRLRAELTVAFRDRRQR